MIVNYNHSNTIGFAHLIEFSSLDTTTKQRRGLARAASFVAPWSPVWLPDYFNLGARTGLASDLHRGPYGLSSLSDDAQS